MAKRNKAVGSGEVMVTGPGCEGKNVISLHGALAYAMDQAGRNLEWGAWYVRDHNDKVQFIVERDTSGVVTCSRPEQEAA